MQTSTNTQAQPVKRHLRNYLLDPRFQLKYTGMVVLVTIAVASVLGGVAYKYSRGQTQSMMTHVAMRPDLSPEVAGNLQALADAEDRKVMLAIVGSIVLLAFALGATGVIITHKVVGPAYKLRLLIREVGDGHLHLAGRLRKGDELQELFEEFAAMVAALRKVQAEEIAELDSAIESARVAGVSDTDLSRILGVRERMQAALDR